MSLPFGRKSTSELRTSFVLKTGTNVQTSEEVAIKLESIRTKHPQLHIEAKFYKIMQGGGESAPCGLLSLSWVRVLTFWPLVSVTLVGIPHLKWCGAEGDYNVLVMELLGPSLEDLFNFCSRKFSIKTVLLLADQLVSRDRLGCRKDFCFLVSPGCGEVWE